MSRSSIPRALRREVQRRDADRCLYCGLLQVGQGATFHVDHVLPRSRGGATSLDNLVLQCPYCSLHKADRTHAKDPIVAEVRAARERIVAAVSGISTSCVSSYALVRPPQEGFPCDTLRDYRNWKPAKRNSKGERQVRPANRHGLDLSSPSSLDGECRSSPAAGR